MEATAAPEAFRREGNIIVVPDGSPLRGRLTTETVQASEVRGTHTLPGVIEADPTRFTRVFLPVTGRVIKLHVQLGEQVTEGQVLATLSAPDFMQAQADYLKAHAALANAQLKLSRARDLLEHKIAAQRDLEDADAAQEAAQADLNSARERLRAYGFEVDKETLGRPLQLVAPVAGKVVELAAALGEFRNDNTLPLLTVADLSTVWLTVSVPEKDLRFLRFGEDVQAALDAYPEEKFAGRVTIIGDVLDPDTRVTKVRVALPNDGSRLKPGMYATVQLLEFPEKVVTVPATALVQVGDDAYVYAQVKPWTFEPVAVTVGRQQNGRAIITAGLQPGVVILAREGVLFQ